MNHRSISQQQAERYLNWHNIVSALERGHDHPQGSSRDVVLQRGEDTMLSRHAWIDGLGALVKTGLIYPNNPAKFDIPTIHGSVGLFDDKSGQFEASIDFGLVTKWKTAGDSLLAAKYLARPDSRNILIIGAGKVAHTLIEAYSALFPDAQFSVWNRTASKARSLVDSFPDMTITCVSYLSAAVAKADIISMCTMTHKPILDGSWLKPGQHIDLIGAYLPEMREVDDTAMKRASIFVDCFDTTVDHIGELIEPIKSGAIERADVIADFYDLKTDKFNRYDPEEITLHKNGGGAHLDLMTARYILDACPTE